MEQFEQNPLPLQEQPQYQEQTLTSTPNLPVPRHWLFKWVAWVIGGLVVLFLVLSVIAYSAQRCSPSLNENCPSNFWEFLLSPDFKNPFSGEVEDEVDDTADWQIYRNTEYGFEFKYPENFVLDLKLIDSDLDWFIVNIINADNLEFVISIEINNQGQGFAPGKDLTEETQIVNNITVNKRVFYETNQGYGSDRKTFLYFFEGNDNRFLITGKPLDDEEVVRLADQILSTFKFIPSTLLGTNEPEVCIQVITPARNSQTGEVRNFPTPCDVPEGWIKI